MKNFLFCLSIILLPFSSCLADHILSGNIGYECLGNGDYKITIELERDCFGQGPVFDDEINVAIYSSEILISNIVVNRGQVLDVVPEDYEDCMASEFELCIEKTNYIFQVNLPIIDEAYTITYQRCCWSAIIGNITEPARTGISITTDITPLAQSLCNTQEISSLPISFLACAGKDVSIELPLKDTEGDSLVYDVCLPFSGGGFEGAGEQFPGDINGCQGLFPIPACPPPYEELAYAPGYDDSNPFPTLDGFNFVDGMLQFTPSDIGFYLSGLCISEYRNGQLLGRKRIPFAILSSVVRPASTKDELSQSWHIETLTDSNIELRSSLESGSASFKLFDVSGRNISINQTSNRYTYQANIGEIPSGIYIIKIQEGSASQFIRFFKP